MKQRDLLVTIRNKVVNNFWKHLHLKESLMKQKSRKKWLNEGDQNTRYFHSGIKGRRRVNSVASIQNS